jgi:hypothetical protein
MLWNLTSVMHPVATGAAFVALGFAFSALHIAAMGPLGELAYGLGGWTYSFPWAQQIPYEIKKELFNYLAMAVIFWFAERPVGAAPAHIEAAAPKVAGEISARSAARDLWLRDGRLSVLIDAGDIVSVSSAGNCVEYDLTDRRKYLIRSTLQAELSRLAPFGIVRVHRTRLINPRCIVALERGPSGDFKLRLDSGEIVRGSRRFKPAIAGLAV